MKMTVIFYNSDESEEEISSTNWTQIASITDNISEDDSKHMLWVNCEYAGINVGEIVGVRVLIDGIERAIDHFSPVLTGQFRTFSPFGMITFSAGLHIVTLEARCVNSSQTIKVRRKRLLVMKY